MSRDLGFVGVWLAAIGLALISDGPLWLLTVMAYLGGIHAGLVVARHWPGEER